MKKTISLLFIAMSLLLVGCSKSYEFAPGKNDIPPIIVIEEQIEQERQRQLNQVIVNQMAILIDRQLLV